MAGPREAQRHLLHVFSTFAVGGPQTRLVSLANALGGKYRHTILAMDDRHEAAAGLDRALSYDFASIPNVRGSGISLRNLRHARQVLRRLRPDLLLTYNWGAIEWSLANLPFALCRHVHVEDGFGPDESPTSQNPRRALARRVLLSGCSRIVVPSRTLYDVATQKWRLAASRVMHLPNGIDYRRFAAPPDPALLAALGLDAHPGPVIGTVAALRKEKNLARLLRIFAALPPVLDARLVIVGDGPELAPLRAEAERLGVAGRVLTPGMMDRPERLLGRFDVFALTSDTEQMPNAILEAMAAGRAVLATDVGDVKRVLASENAPFVLPREDEASLIQGLRALLEQPDLRAEIGRRNQERVRTEYDLETMVARYDALFSA